MKYLLPLAAAGVLAVSPIPGGRVLAGMLATSTVLKWGG